MNRTCRGLVWAAGCLAMSLVAVEGLWAQGYLNPPANPRYAPPREEKPVGPAPVAGTKPQPIQLVGGEEPIRQPAGPTQPIYGPVRPVQNPPAARQAPAGQAAPRGPVAGPVDPRQTRPINNPVGNPPINQPATENLAGGPPPANVGPAPPAWMPLPQEHLDYIDNILNFWEAKSDTIEQYKCKFTRWEFDPLFGPKEINTAKTISEGVIQYGKPDKGLFRVEKVSNFTPAAEGKKPTYTEAKDAIGEHWVCDGIRIFEFDSKDKQVIERTLPPEMQGKAITEGPLPFLFGAKAAEIKARYWLRARTPKESKGEYWLEAYPKTAQDAANFLKVLVIIDEKDFLPKAIDVFTPNFDKSKTHTAYSFENREVYGKKSGVQQTLDKLRLFHAEFYSPKLPFGWKKIVDNSLAGPPPEGPLKPASNGQATRPTMLPK